MPGKNLFTVTRRGSEIVAVLDAGYITLDSVSTTVVALLQAYPNATEIRLERGDAN